MIETLPGENLRDGNRVNELYIIHHKSVLKEKPMKTNITPAGRADLFNRTRFPQDRPGSTHDQHSTQEPLGEPGRQEIAAAEAKENRDQAALNTSRFPKRQRTGAVQDLADFPAASVTGPETFSK